jgi:hypothetical protein
MYSLEPEIERLRPLLGDARTDYALDRERRDVFSVQPELRIAAWGGVMLLVAAVGVLIKNNLDRIGPLAIAIGIGLVAAACYAWVTWRRNRASLADDYVLLLGALLVSADIAFLEAQFHLLGDRWRQHLLLIAILHAVTAYSFRSRVVLSLAITSLAGWIGADPRYSSPGDYTLAAFLTVAALMVWRFLDRRFAKTDFSRTLEHFAANIALLGGFSLMDHSVPLGCMVAITIASAVVAWGFHTRSEWFVLYAFLYGVVAMNILLIDFLRLEALGFFLVLLSTIGSIVALFRIHATFKEMQS